MDAIEQFQVITFRAQAELGRAVGGYINVCHQERHQPAPRDRLLVFRDDGLNAKPRLSGTKLPMRQSQFGASVGGPFRRNRTFSSATWNGAIWIRPA